MADAEPYRFPDAARLAAWQRVLGSCLVTEDVYPGIARRFLAAGVGRFVESVAAPARCRASSSRRAW